jgi:hypothetical protein
LALWLQPYRGEEGLVWSKSTDNFHWRFAQLRTELKIPAKQNGLRHGYISYLFAINNDENKTAVQAGNSPRMIHAAYKSLVRKDEAARWFAVKPSSPEAQNIVPLQQAAENTL